MSCNQVQSQSSRHPVSPHSGLRVSSSTSRMNVGWSLPAICAPVLHTAMPSCICHQCSAVSTSHPVSVFYLAALIADFWCSFLIFFSWIAVIFLIHQCCESVSMFTQNAHIGASVLCRAGAGCMWSGHPRGFLQTWNLRISCDKKTQIYLI